MIYVISDLHGYPIDRFFELLDKAGFSFEDQLYVIGDVVDRGNDGISYLLWLMEQDNAELILGNHEDMMRKCDFLFEPDALERMSNLEKSQKTNLGIWMSNGAESTIKGLFGISIEERQRIFSYLGTLPVFKRLEIGERRFLLTHSGLRDYAPGKPIENYSEHDLIWNRPALTDRYSDDELTVFGHTPTCIYSDRYKGKIIETDTWIDIDVGAGYGFEPVLLRLDDMVQFTN